MSGNIQNVVSTNFILPSMWAVRIKSFATCRTDMYGAKDFSPALTAQPNAFAGSK